MLIVFIGFPKNYSFHSWKKSSGLFFSLHFIDLTTVVPYLEGGNYYLDIEEPVSPLPSVHCNEVIVGPSQNIARY